VLGSVFADEINHSVTQAFGLNAEWAITPGLAVFGRYAFGATDVVPLEGPVYSRLHSTTWHAGLTFPDFLSPGNALGIAYGQPVRVHSGTRTDAEDTASLVPSGVEGDIEVFWRIRLSDRLTLTPDLQFFVQPVHSLRSNGLTVGTLRAVFSF
jgi:porin